LLYARQYVRFSAELILLGILSIYNRLAMKMLTTRYGLSSKRLCSQILSRAIPREM
jgi:hypothetical protein